MRPPITEKGACFKMYNTSISHIEKVTGRIYRLENVIIENPDTSYSRQTSFVRNVEMYYLGRKKLLHYYQVLTTHFSYSNEDNAMGMLLRKISYVFDEVELLADDENNIVKVLNLPEIRKRWLTTAEILFKDHKGEAIENYFHTISNMLENEKSVISFLNEYKMFGLFFNGQCSEYHHGIKKKRIIFRDDENKRCSLFYWQWKQANASINYEKSTDNHLAKCYTMQFPKNRTIYDTGNR